MKRLFTSVLAIAALLAGNIAMAGNGVSLKPVRSNQTVLSFSITDFSLSNVDINGVNHHVIQAGNTIPNLEAGMPNVPTVSSSIMIENYGNTEIEILNATYTDYPNVNLVPSKGNMMRNVLPSEVAYTKGSQYQVDAFYPSEIVKLNDPFVMRDVRGQVIVTNPFQYNPVTKVLRVYNTIEVAVSNVGGQGINELHASAPQKVPTQFLNMYQDRFINYNQQYRYTPIAEAGGMLIICADQYMTAMEEYKNWKIAKGIPTEMVSINTVGNSENSIRTYIANYYNANQNAFVLLVGDHNTVNTANLGTSSYGETLWSDTRYAYITGNDKYPEVMIGRLSASSNAHINTQITRGLEYEKTPLNGDWYSKAIGLGSAEGPGDDGEYDNQHLRNIRTELMNYGFTEVHEFYDGSQGGADANGNPTSTMVSNAVNDGVTLFNYTGHGDQNTCISGNYGSSQINNGTNYGKYPFVISVACNNGTFATGTCLAEDFLRANNNSQGPKGGIACAASSILMAWAPPMETQDEMTKILTESYSNNKKYTLGGLFYNAQCSMLDDYFSQGNEVMDTWVFFGDPSITIRTADPAVLTASHVGDVPLGTSSLAVTCNVNGAFVCVSQNNEILGTATVSGGVANVSFTGLTSTSPLTVVATKYNYKPYQGTVTVEGTVGIEEAKVNDFKMFPNPTEGNVTIEFDVEQSQTVSVRLLNAVGQEVQVLAKQSMTGQQVMNFDASFLSAGLYYVEIQSETTKIVEKLTIK